MSRKISGAAPGRRLAKSGNSLVPAASRAPVPMQQPDGALVVRDGPATLVTGRAYAAGGNVVPADAIYFSDEVAPRADGPWLGEADKVAWRDPASGYDLIMMRARDGNLCGYVGVPRAHPLHGWESGAVPAGLGIEVHGGITYSRICDGGPSPDSGIRAEARRICHSHVTPLRREPIANATGQRAEGADAWWFGFECDCAGDLVPGNVAHAERAAAAGMAQVYRDHAYVLRETLDLAAQLRAVEDGRPVPPRSGPPLPPIGPDPKRRG